MTLLHPELKVCTVYIITESFVKISDVICVRRFRAALVRCAVNEYDRVRARQIHLTGCDGSHAVSARGTSPQGTFQKFKLFLPARGGLPNR